MEKVTRRIKISYFDPDATDSSSDEQEIDRTKKRKIHLINVEIPNSLKLGTPHTPDEPVDAYNSKKHEIAEKLRSAKLESLEDLSSSCVEQHQYEENASLAVKKGGSRDSVLEAFGENKKEDNEGETKFGFVEGVQVVDTNGFLVGDFSKIDDLSICANEDGQALI